MKRKTLLYNIYFIFSICSCNSSVEMCVIPHSRFIHSLSNHQSFVCFALLFPSHSIYYYYYSVMVSKVIFVPHETSFTYKRPNHWWNTSLFIKKKQNKIRNMALSSVSEKLNIFLAKLKKSMKMEEKYGRRKKY